LIKEKEDAIKRANDLQGVNYRAGIDDGKFEHHDRYKKV
jgi:hypothetical protein